MTNWLGTNLEKPSDEMLAVLEGRLHHDDASPAVRSMIRLQYFNAAVVIVKMESKESRKKALQKIPETARKMVHDEVVRLWNDQRK